MFCQTSLSPTPGGSASEPASLHRQLTGSTSTGCTIGSSALARCSCAYVAHRCSALCQLSSQLRPNLPIVFQHGWRGSGEKRVTSSCCPGKGKGVILPLILTNRLTPRSSLTPCPRSSAGTREALQPAALLRPSRVVGDDFMGTGAIVVPSISPQNTCCRTLTPP